MKISRSLKVKGENILEKIEKEGGGMGGGRKGEEEKERKLGNDAGMEDFFAEDFPQFLDPQVFFFSFFIFFSFTFSVFIYLSILFKGNGPRCSWTPHRQGNISKCNNTYKHFYIS